MHEEYMRHALELARYGEGRTSPNPLVGAVVVRDGRIVGQGWHRKAGTPHAEVHALRQAGELARQATMYVTLEPCAHFGRTPPCSQAIIDAGVRRVVVAMTDPNPLVAGKGIERLRAVGIEVIVGILEKEALTLNEVFVKWITTGMPYIILKAAMTLDGKIATAAGESQWITGEAAREEVHKMRDLYDGILTGIGTVLADDPSLTTRLAHGGKNPQRIVVDSMARTPLHAKVIADGLAPTFIAVTTRAPADKVAALQEAGAQVLIINDGDRVALKMLFVALGKQKISSVFVEGGAAINGTLIQEKLPDKFHFFIAPKLIGGEKAPTLSGGSGIAQLADALLLRDLTVRTAGQDFWISAYAKRGES